MQFRKFSLAAAGLLLWTAPFLAGCAKAPATAGSGRRLAVTLVFNGPVNANNQYFFLIRNANDVSGQNGPVPIVFAPYVGNGFATGLNSNGVAFTDFVSYSNARASDSSGYGIYHVTGGPNGHPENDAYERKGVPVLTQAPSGANGNILYFEIDLNQIAPDANELAIANDTRPRYLQVNMVATTAVHPNQVSEDPSKVTDAFGDQTNNSGSFNKYLQIDTNQSRIYSSTDAVLNLEERDHDTFSTGGAYDPSVDLISWSIQVK